MFKPTYKNTNRLLKRVAKLEKELENSNTFAVNLLIELGKQKCINEYFMIYNTMPPAGYQFPRTQIIDQLTTLGMDKQTLNNLIKSRQPSKQRSKGT